MATKLARAEPPPPGMGDNSQMLRAFTYCVFVGIWEDDVGFMLDHPDALGPKCVRLSFLMKDVYEGPRALLTVHAAATGMRAFAPFPPIPAVLVAAPNTRRFVDSHAALRRLIGMMIERVTPSLLPRCSCRRTTNRTQTSEHRIGFAPAL